MPHSSATTTTGITTRRAALAVTCLLAGLVPAAVSHADDDKTPGKQHHSTETCRGVRATHVNEPGTKGDDVIVITDAGIAEMYAGAGDDLICMKMMRSDDIQGVHGGTGNDTIITYSGQIYAFGGVGNDTILSNSADLILSGGSGNDTIYMGRHPDELVHGGGGNDIIFGTPFADHMDGGTGNDMLIGFAGNDWLDGGDGDDRLEGREGTDELDGRAGDDTCIDEAAPGTTFVLCETIVGLAGQGPGGLQFG